MPLPLGTKWSMTRLSPPCFHSRYSNPEPDGFPLGRLGLALLALWGFALLGGFFVAYRLEPDPRGFGTHQRLGLPPCTIRTVFGVPCPSCGMTTSFANLAKGHFVHAARANTTAC